MTKTSITGDLRKDARLIAAERRRQDVHDVEERALERLASTDPCLKAQRTGGELRRDLVTLDVLKETPRQVGCAQWSRGPSRTEDRLETGLRGLLRLRRTMHAARRAAA
jgi:hypothetical protein